MALTTELSTQTAPIGRSSAFSQPFCGSASSVEGLPYTLLRAKSFCLKFSSNPGPLLHSQLALINIAPVVVRGEEHPLFGQRLLSHCFDAAVKSVRLILGVLLNF